MCDALFELMKKEYAAEVAKRVSEGTRIPCL